MGNILITGGAGFIGSHLTTQLTREGSSVTIIDSLITGSEHNLSQLLEQNKIKFIKGDIADPHTLDALHNTHFDVIFHLASPASPVQYTRYPQETLRANSIGTWNLLNFLREGGGEQLIYTSTSEVYGDPLIHPQTEEYWGNVNSFGPRSCYDESKRFGEALCYTYISTYALTVKIARLFNTYGPNMEQNDGRVISNFVMQALRGEDITIYGDGSQTRSFCYVSDTVNALCALSKANIPDHIVNIGNPEEYSIRDVATMVKRVTKTNSHIVYKDATTDDPKRRKPDISRAKKYLSWSPVVPFSEGLAKTVPYFKERFIHE